MEQRTGGEVMAMRQQPLTRAQIEQIDKLEKYVSQNRAMRELLERWVSASEVWLGTTRSIDPFLRVLDDTKTLLKKGQDANPR
jgi:hypothetical protein